MIMRNLCKTCGTENESDAVFCKKCGKEISKEETAEPIELAKLYLTTNKRRKIGVIALTTTGIIAYNGKPKLFGKRNLREDIYAEMDFSDILHINFVHGLLTKRRISIHLKKEKYKEIMSQHGSILRGLIELFSDKGTLEFYTLSDTHEEIRGFVERTMREKIKSEIGDAGIKTGR